MKKVLNKVHGLTIALLAIIICASIFTACTPPPAGEPYEGAYVSIEIEAEGEEYKATAISYNGTDQTTYLTTGEAENIGNILNLLTDKGLHLASTDSEWGTMITELGSLIPNASANEFVAFYSTSTDLQYSFMEVSLLHNGKTYYSCNFGADSMPILEGVSYIFVIGTY